MVAYSFQPQFVSPIELRTKRQTIRLPRRGRSRHARPGEPMQLFKNARRKGMARIIPDPICTSVREVAFLFCPDDPDETEILDDGRAILGRDREPWARADGFESFEAMSAFWLKTHGSKPFHGVLITWTDPT